MWLALSAGPAASERPAIAAADVALDAAATPVRPCRPATPVLPEHVRVDRLILPRVREMIRRSPAFRRQCQRLADLPWVHVAVRLDPRLASAQTYRAMSVIQRPQPTLIVAIVMLEPLADPALWLAHELEHVLEQVDGVDVARLASRKRNAWRVSDTLIETARAVEAGELVLDELRTEREPDNIVD